MKSTTFTSTLNQCKHKNIKYKNVNFDFLIIRLTKKFDLCVDCGELIPVENGKIFISWL